MPMIRKAFISQLRSSYPALEEALLESIVSENLISPFQVQLPRHILQQAQEIIATTFSMRQREEYSSFMAEQAKALGLNDPGNNSMAMSYDFHINEQGDLKLIEINTNASFLLLGYEMYLSQKKPLPVADFNHDEIKNMILQELHLNGKKTLSPTIAIIDEKPQEQRLYVEFLAYNELFKKFSWNSRIADISDVQKENAPDFIYNRYTDFYLEQSHSRDLRQLFLERRSCFSPNPFEYLLLADKQRLIEWSQPGFYQRMGLTHEQTRVMERMLPEAYDVNAHNKEDVWAKRKKFFFKPKRAFGSKQSFKGSSISRKAFDEMNTGDTIAQEYVHAPETTYATENGPLSFKYDLRCYAYQGRLQMIVARLYQGQVTNLRTPLGGFACVEFI